VLLADSSTAISIGAAVVAAAAAAITLLASVVWRLRDRQSKTLDYRVISDTDIVISHNRPEKLKVVYGPDEDEVKDPRVTEIRFKNTGKQIIETDDFLEAVKIRRPNARILDFDVVEQSENHLVDEDKSELVMAQPDRPEYVRLFPRTLNSGDWFTVQLVYDGRGSSSDMVFTTRIKGQTRKIAAFTAASDVARRRRRVWMAIAGFGLSAVLICASIVIQFNTVLLNVASVCFFVGVFALFDLISTRRRARA
jgi:hypothetical protein